MCTLSPKCKERTSKIGMLNRYKREEIPKNSKYTIRQAKEIYHFNEEDLENITEEDLEQPCNRGRECPQEDIGIHSRACKIEMKHKAERPLGQTWDDVVQHQEAFNADPSEWIHDQNKNRYDYEERKDRRRRNRKEESEEEEEEDR